MDQRHVSRGKAGIAKKESLGEEGGPILTSLDDEHLGTELEYLSRSTNQIGLTGDLASLGVIDYQCIDERYRLQQFLGRPLDPVVHGVHGHEASVNLLSHLALQGREDVRQEDEGCATSSLTELGLEICKDVQLCVEGFGRIEIVAVFTHPAKCLTTLDALNSAGVNAAFDEDRAVFFGEVIPDNSYYANLGEERGCN